MQLYSNAIKPFQFHLKIMVRHVRRVKRVETSVSSESSHAVPTWRTTNKL